jgi:glutamate synthase domain-containing protein 3
MKTLTKKRRVVGELPPPEVANIQIDLARTTIRDLNQQLHDLPETRVGQTPPRRIILNPKGLHAVACGVRVPALIEIQGHVGYYCAGMNEQATILIKGNAGVGLAENMMSGYVHVQGNASQSAGATGHGGLLVIEGDASARCGISMKGIEIVVKGSVGHLSGFMAQSGTLVVCGDAGEALGDSIYEARIYVRGRAQDLGTDCIEKPMRAEHLNQLAVLLEKAGFKARPEDFRRYGSGRKLYNFHVDNVSAY